MNSNRTTSAQIGSKHADATVQKEIGWGSSSFTKGNCSYGNIVLQSCAIYVSQRALMICMMDAHDGSDMTRTNRKVSI